MNKPTHEIDAYLDGEPTPDQARALETWIQSDKANAHAFLAAIRLHQQIGTQLRKDRFDQALRNPGQPATTKDGDAAIQALFELARLHEEGLKQPIDLERHDKQRANNANAIQDPGFRLTRKLIITGSLAATIALAGLTVLIVNLFSGPDQPIAEQADESIVVATLTDVKDAQWASASLARGSALYAGDKYTLTAGFAEITTQRGAAVILEAPATIELLNSDNALHLHAGKLVGLCHTESSKGFVVKTDHADITDLSTEFGVTVTPDLLEATVFVGEIAVKTPQAPSKVITHDQTARVSLDRSRPELVIEDKLTEGFARRLPRDPLIIDATINLEGFKVNVLHEGVYEDVKLYTDREDELNGLDATGIPAFLLGGDLVQMPADARTDRTHDLGNDLQLELTLSAPAEVYMLLRDDKPSEPWIKRDYELTGFTVGKDQGKIPHVKTQQHTTLGKGPGVSIDGNYFIWKRKQPANGRTIVAGPMTNDYMYAIIALPQQNNDTHPSTRKEKETK